MILAVDNDVGTLTGVTDSFAHHAWHKQEFTKGTTVWHELNSLPFLDLNVACEGGWGINSYYSLNPLWYVYQYGFTEKAKTDLSREDAITHPLFTPFRSESEAMHSTNLFTIADASYRNELRAKFLADAIPATSFAAGNSGEFWEEFSRQRQGNKQLHRFREAECAAAVPPWILVQHEPRV